MTSVKKIKVALLALVAALVIAIPTSAFADITINEANTSHEYGAYQVFKGDIDDQGKLTNVEWGEGVDGEALTADLKANGPADVKAYLADIDSPTAAQVAAAINEVESNTTTTRADIDAIADIINKHLATQIGPVTYNADEQAYIIPVTDDGYFFIKDVKTEGLTGDPTALTRYILTLSNVESVNPKSDVPQVEKGVIEDSDNPVDDPETDVDERAAYEAALDSYNATADYDIRQGIPYKLEGTLPSAYGDYTKGYKYVFHDVMSDGLTMSDDQVDAVTVWLYDGDEAQKEITSFFTAANNGEITFAGQELTVGIKNLKVAVSDADFAACTDPKIVVFYKASLTDDCVVGDKGNPNGVYLEFSNNPNWDGEGEPETDETPWDYCVVFTYTLDDTKEDAATAEKLKDAKFKLQAMDGEFKDLFAVVENGKLTGWDATGTELVSDENGKFGVIGLDAGEYQLIETAAPAGYNAGGPYPFTITAVTALDKSQGMEGGSVTSLTLNNTATDIAGDPDEGTVGDTILNTSGSGLPSTGGIGTTIFTIVGIALIVAAAAIMVIRRRNAAAVQ